MEHIIGNKFIYISEINFISGCDFCPGRISSNGNCTCLVACKMKNKRPKALKAVFSACCL